MPKVSVIITAYNCESTIKKCIDSVVDQTMNDYELIVVNDGSTDNTELEVLKYKEVLGSKLKYFYKDNTGVADTRNYGLEKATGEYIMYIDSDDYIDTELLAKQETNLNDSVDVIKFKMIQVEENGKEICKIDGPVFDAILGQDAFNKLYYQDILIDQPCIYLFRREYFKDNNFRFLAGTIHEDFGLIPIVIANAKTMISTNIYGYYYVQTPNSITRENSKEKIIKKTEDSFLHYDNMLKTIENQDLTTFTKENIRLYYTNSILLKIRDLPQDLKKHYLIEFKKRKMIKNIKIRNLKQFLKRILIAISPNLYFKLR
ncbi:MAG: glycosyltransferase family 2 protein [Clostridia bacterium]|nr:glycosyltransferase family 2 protein [Clostridia bacterium]